MQAMKRSVGLVIAAVAILSLVIGCASTSSGVTSTGVPTDLPDFMLKPPKNRDALYGIGQAKSADSAMALTTAKNRALVSLAQQINVNVQNMFTDFTQTAGVAGSEQILQFQQNVTRNLTQAKLSGAQIEEQYIAKDGTWFVLMSLNIGDAKSAVQASVNAAADQNAAYAAYKAEKAVAAMNDALDRSLAADQPAPKVVSE